LFELQICRRDENVEDARQIMLIAAGISIEL